MTSKRIKDLTLRYKVTIIAVIAILFCITVAVVIRTVSKVETYSQVLITVIQSENKEPIAGLAVIYNDQQQYTSSTGQATLNNVKAGDIITVNGSGLFQNVAIAANSDSLNVSISYSWLATAREYVTYELQRKYDLVYNLLSSDVKSEFSGLSDFVQQKNEWRDKLLDNQKAKLLNVEFEPNLQPDGTNFIVTMKLTWSINNNQLSTQYPLKIGVSNGEWIIFNNTLFPLQL